MRVSLSLLCVFSFWLFAAPRIDAQGAGPEAGIKVYAAQKCSICHSIAGAGNKKLPLDGVASKLTAAQIKEWIVSPVEAAKKANSTIKPPMKAMNLPPADVDALVAYLTTLKK